jgi:hypothetical protein
MSVRRRQNWLGQQRVDAPHLKSIESAVSNDFDELIKGLVIGENKSYVVRGFEISMPGAISSSATGLQLLVENSAILHGASDESGTFYTIPTGTNPELLNPTVNSRVQGSFTPSADNFIGIEFLRNINDSTTDQVNFWNPTSNIEFTKTVPLAITLDYKIVINTTLTSNVLPIAVVKTNSSNNVESITDRRPMLYRLGTAGFSNPNPFHLYDWSEGRTENFYTSFSSTSNPFAGGDKQIATMKDFFDAIMTEFKLLKGTPFWYSESAGSISRLRQDIANMAFTGKGNVIHGAFDFQGIQTGMTTSVIIKTIDTSVSGPITLTANGVDTIDTIIFDHNFVNPTNQVYLYSGNGLQVPSANITLESKAGQLNWTDDLFLNFIGGRLRYRILKNEASNHITLSNNQVAYVKLVRGVNIVPNIKFTQTSTIVESVGGVIWTTDLQPGDFIKDASKGDEFYYQIASVDVGGFQVTLTQPYQETSTGLSGINAQYAFGVYETNSAPSSDRHIKILDRGSVPFGEDYFWLYYRQDELLGSIAKIYARILGGQELQQGEWQQVSDNTSESVLQYIGSPSESDIDPNYTVLADNAKSGTTNYNASNGENLTARISKITSMVADKAQDKTIKLVSDHTYAYNSTNGTLQEVSFSGGSGTATVVMPSSADNGFIVLSDNFSLGVNQVAYFFVTRNGGFVYTSLSTLVISDISSVPLHENVFIFAYRLNDTNVHLWNNQVLLPGSSVSTSVLREQVQQNKTAKLVKGGTWSWDLVSNTLTNSTDAYIQVAGITENSNRITAQSIVLNSDGRCAYVVINRSSFPSTTGVLVGNISSILGSNDLFDDNIFIIARRVGNDVIVGTNSFALKDGEFLELDGALAEINRHHGQLVMRPKSPVNTRIRISGSDILKLSGSKLSLEQKKLLLSFEGVEIDFASGLIYETDGITSFLGGINNFTPATIGANEYFYYSISVLPFEVQPDNTISGQILVIPASASNSVLANAPKAPFPSAGIKLGNIYVQENGVGGILPISYPNITQLSVGGSGSGGTGDANSFTENLKHRLTSSYYEYVTPVVFEISEKTLTDSASATFSVVDGTYSFSAASQDFISVNMFDTEFLQNEDDSRRIELHAEWFDDASRDDAASYEVSLDGTNYEIITMDRQGLSQKFTGSKLLAIPANATVSTQASTNTTTELNATTVQSFSAPVVLATKNAVRQLALEINKLGSPVGSYIISICEDNAGVPGNVLYSKIALVSTLSAGTNVITLNNFRNVLPIGTFYIRIETDATYKSGFSTGVNSIRLNTNTGGNDLVYNGASWSVGTTDLKYTLLGHGYDLRVKITSSAANKKLKAFGIFYDEHVGDVVTGIQALQKFVFSGDLNTTSFTLTRFLPDPDNMKVYDIKTGQVYRYPAFSISGHTVTFPAGTFLAPGETVELIFDQSQGSGFDHSDQNGNLLAANHLGSTDPTIDKSSPGRGIFLKKPNGELVEVCVDDANNIVIYSV